jgi:acyl-CoA thioesterase FadM
MSYTYYWDVRMGDVDGAKVAFYPTIFVKLFGCVEDIFAEIDYPLHRKIPEEGVGIPIVHAEADYHQPIFWGDTVEIRIDTSLEETSITFEAEGYVDEHVFTASEAHVMVSWGDFSSMEIPAEIRENIQ